jgi:RHS repeat-associated protein
MVVLLACALGGKQPQPPEPTGDGSGPGGLGISCPSYDPAVFPPDLGVSSSSATFPTVPGSFAVSPTGEATYTIPLIVPPGRAGVEPSLAITYGSSAGEGLLGVGFGLRGLSAITRCASNLAQDGRIRPVEYDAQDQLCLDGARLVEVAAQLGPNGSSTHEFRTVPDSFTKVVGHFEAATGPQSFEAYTKAGRILDYGGTVDSRAMAKGQVVAAWWASKERDRHGNAVRYVYANDVDAADGHTREITPARIGYAYRDDHKPGREVVLVHEPSPTASTYYSGGMRLRRSQRLAEVRMITQPGEAVVRSYHLAYEPGAGTGRTLLRSVKECAGELGPCKPETTFAWSSHAPGVPIPSVLLSAPAAQEPGTSTWLLADVNGDGLPDLVMSNPGPKPPCGSPYECAVTPWPGDWYVALADGLSYAPWKKWASIPGNNDPSTGIPFDYDQDGRTDIVFPYDFAYQTGNTHPNGGLAVLLAGPGNSFDLVDTGILLPPPQSSGWRLGDINGDGVADYLQCTPDGTGYAWSVQLWSPDGPGFEAASIPIPELVSTPCSAIKSKELRIVDLDGDGKAEIVTPNAGFYENGTFHLDGSVTCSGQPCTYHALSHTGQDWTRTDTGLMVHPVKIVHHDSQVNTVGDTVFVDLDGDGLPDAMKTGYADGRPRTFLNTGAGFTAGVPSLSGPLLPDGYREDHLARLAIPMDVNGDGLTDLVMPMHFKCGDPTDPTPCWVALEASLSGDGTFTVRPLGIPFLSEDESWTTGNDPGFFLQVADVDGNGRHDLVASLPAAASGFMVHRSDGPQDLLLSLADGTNPLAPGEPGFVPSVAIQYGNLIDEGVTKGIAKGALAHDDLTYVAEDDPGNDCAYPRACVKGSERVVRSYTVNNGQNGGRAFQVKYRDGRYHRLGRGFLGFGERIVIDGDTAGGVVESFDNITHDEVFDTFPFAGQVVRRLAWSATRPHWLDPGQVEMSFTARSLEQVPTSAGSTYFTLPTGTSTTRQEGTMTPGSGQSVLRFAKAAESSVLYVLGQSSSAVLAYDTFGNILQERADADGADLSSTVTRTYDDDPATWLIGRMKTEEVCSTSMAMTQCRSTVVERDAFGEVTSATTGDPADANTQVTTALWRDALGHVTFTTADDTSGHHRWGCTTYDADHLFPYATANALGHVTYTRFDPALGVMTAAVDPNGLTTQWQHDAFGSVTEERRADGTRSTVSLVRTKDGGPQAKWFNAKVTTSETNSATTTTELDAAGRPVHAWTAAADVTSCGAVKCTPGLVLEEETTYDFLGRVTRATLPWMSGDALQGKAFHAYQYDAAGRMTKHTEPWGRVTTIAYDANTTTTTDWLGTTSVQVDELGRPKRATDRKGYTTETTYGPFGAAWAVMRTGLEITWSEHDAYGRVVREVDPDRGVTDLAYDGFGEALTTDDAQGRHYAFTYDDLGRLVRRDDPDGTVRWAYDTAAHGIGKLASVTNAASVKQYAYDGLSRPAMEALTLTDTGDQVQAGFAYDGQGRLQMVAYPQVAGVNPLVVRREYDTYGNLVTVRDNADGTRYWHLQGLDGAGRPAIEKLGSGVFAYHDHDPYSGMVKHIQADRGTGAGAVTLQNLAYAYDKGLRMTSRADQLQVGPKGVRHELFTHDELGRLTCSRFVDVQAGQALRGTFGGRCETSIAYDPTGNITSKSHVGAYTYDPAHPHAVAKAGGEGFGYDAVGNQITRPDAAITYTAFDLPEVVTPTSGDPAVHFTYDGDHRRIRKQSSAQETLYFEGMYERVGGANGGAAHRYYVGAGSATVVLTRQVGGTDKVAYLHADALGSTDVVTDGAGKVASNAGERRSYDAFGARRNPAWGQPAPAGGFSSKASPMGFTGHEGDDELGLINMRGRIYDPRLGRFLSTDPIVSSPHFGQSWNPYSYVHNSPLNFTDPSGFDELGTYQNLGGVSGQFPVVVPMLADPESGIAPKVKLPSGTAPPPPMKAKDAMRDDTPGGEPPRVQFDAVRTDKVEKSVLGVLAAVSDTVEDAACPLCAAGKLLLGLGNTVRNTPPSDLARRATAAAGMPALAALRSVVETGVTAKRLGDEGDYETSAKLWTSVAITGVSFALGGAGAPEGAMEAEVAAGGGEVWNARGGVDFAKSEALYPAGAGQRSVVRIEYTGSRRADFRAANEAAGLGKTPKDYTWHHLDDYHPETNTGTLQLVERGAHQANQPHVGGVKQYTDATGTEYH